MAGRTTWAEKLRPQTGWLPLAFALDWNRPPRQMNSTSFFTTTPASGAMKLTAQELLSPLADASRFTGHLIDFNVRAERMGWLPSAPQLNLNPLHIKARAEAAGLSPQEYTVQALKSGDIRFACEQPDSGKTTRAICLSGARTCLAPPAKATSTCSSICSAPKAGSREKI